MHSGQWLENVDGQCQLAKVKRDWYKIRISIVKENSFAFKSKAQ
jgi:hypothetical protein